MIVLEEFRVETPKREVLVNITSEINKIVRNTNINEGVCRIFVPHTTAGVTINENADPAVMKDIISYLNKLIPQRAGFSHMEGNSDAHIKASLIGSSVTVLVESNRLVLGTWQHIFFYEGDGPRKRRVIVDVISNK